MIICCGDGGGTGEPCPLDCKIGPDFSLQSSTISRSVRSCPTWLLRAVDFSLSFNTATSRTAMSAKSSWAAIGRWYGKLVKVPGTYATAVSNTECNSNSSSRRLCNNSTSSSKAERRTSLSNVFMFSSSPSDSPSCQVTLTSEISVVRDHLIPTSWPSLLKASDQYEGVTS